MVTVSVMSSITFHSQHNSPPSNSLSWEGLVVGHLLCWMSGKREDSRRFSVDGVSLSLQRKLLTEPLVYSNFTREISPVSQTLGDFSGSFYRVKFMLQDPVNLIFITGFYINFLFSNRDTFHSQLTPSGFFHDSEIQDLNPKKHKHLSFRKHKQTDKHFVGGRNNLPLFFPMYVHL